MNGTENTTEKVCTVLIHYARALDERNWSLLNEVFTEDAVAKYGANSTLEGREAIIGGIRSFLDNCGPSQHMISNIEVIESDDGIVSRSYVRAVHRGRDSEAILWSFGEYHAQWIRMGEKLRVKRWEMRVTFNHGDNSVFGSHER